MTKSSKIWTIIKHEYTSKVRSKGFIISTLITPILMIGVLAIPILVAEFSFDSVSKKLAIIDKIGNIGNQLVAADTNRYYIANSTEKELKNSLIDETIDGYVVIDDNFLVNNTADVYTLGGGGIGFIADLESRLSDIAVKEKLKKYDANNEILNIVNEDIDLNKHKITTSGQSETDFTEIYAGLGYAFGFVIYMMLMIYGSFVMRGVIEEKANRIVEIIASSAKPYEIMMGKVIGIGFVGLTQMLTWVILGLIILTVGGSIATSMFMNEMSQMPMQTGSPAMGGLPFEIPSIPIGTLVAFVYFFFVGYFMYATLFAAVGSAVDQEQDAQQLMAPVMIPLIIPILLMSGIITSPDSTFSVVLSLIPFFTPVLMTARIAASNVPFWQIALSVILTLSTFLATIYVSGKIYKVGIMMYGTQPKIKDLWKWFKMAK